MITLLDHVDLQDLRMTSPGNDDKTRCKLLDLMMTWKLGNRT